MAAVKQAKKDKHRTRITISKSCEETIINYIGNKEWGISRGVEELINTLRDIGISSFDQLLTINEQNDELKKENRDFKKTRYLKKTIYVNEIRDLKETIAELKQKLEEYEN